MKKQTSRRRIDVNVEELDRVIDETEKGPLNEADRQKLRTAVHAMAEKLLRSRNTEKTGAVLGDQDSHAPVEEESAETNKNKPAGHGRNRESMKFWGSSGVEEDKMRLRWLRPTRFLSTNSRWCYGA